MAKPLLRRRARQLRQQGLGIKTIAHKLKISSSTVSLWCRDIQLTLAQIKTLEQRNHDPFYGRRLAYILHQQHKRQQKIIYLRQKGIKEIGRLTPKELFLIGVSFYWCEGFKKDNQVGFANSDPFLLKLFLIWLKNCCHIPKSRLKLRVTANELYRNKIESIESYWSKTLDISKSQFQKPFFQKVQWKKIYDHPEDYHGVLRIRVSRSTDFLHQIHGWIEGLKQNT